MKSVVVYYSKSGNTCRIAEVIAGELHCEALPLNLVNKGRLSRQEAALEQSYFSDALGKAQSANLVIIGTPTEFRKPHPVVADFLNRSRIHQAAIFCTYYGMMGGTLLDMEAILRKQGAVLFGRTAFRLGTEANRYRHNVQEYVEEITVSTLESARIFAKTCVADPSPIPSRLKGICGNECLQCVSFQVGDCPGAGTNCWSGRECDIYKCCVLKKSLPDCGKCQYFIQCNLNQRRSQAASPLNANNQT